MIHFYKMWHSSCDHAKFASPETIQKLKVKRPFRSLEKKIRFMGKRELTELLVEVETVQKSLSDSKGNCRTNLKCTRRKVMSMQH